MRISDWSSDVCSSDLSPDIWEDPFLGADDGHTAFIKLRSQRVDIRGYYDDLLPGVSHTRLRLAYTDYVHDEVDGDVVFSRYSDKVYDGDRKRTRLNSSH